MLLRWFNSLNHATTQIPCLGFFSARPAPLPSGPEQKLFSKTQSNPVPPSSCCSGTGTGVCVTNYLFREPCLSLFTYLITRWTAAMLNAWTSISKVGPKRDVARRGRVRPLHREDYLPLPNLTRGSNPSQMNWTRCTTHPPWCLYLSRGNGHSSFNGLRRVDAIETYLP